MSFEALELAILTLTLADFTEGYFVQEGSMKAIMGSTASSRRDTGALWGDSAECL